MDRTRSYKTRTSTHVKLKVIALAYGNEVAVGFQCRALLSPSSLICRRPSMAKVEHFMNSILFRASDDGRCPDGLFFDEDIHRNLRKPTKGLHGKLTESPVFPCASLKSDRSLALGHAYDSEASSLPPHHHEQCECHHMGRQPLQVANNHCPRCEWGHFNASHVPDTRWPVQYGSRDQHRFHTGVGKADRGGHRRRHPPQTHSKLVAEHIHPRSA